MTAPVPRSSAATGHDLVERLRQKHENWALGQKGPPILLEAANEIERLEFEYERADQSAKRLGAKWKEAVEGSGAVAQTEPKHDHRVFFVCECCEEHAPENGVSCREDIGVMPDGTWLCDGCYSDCDKSAHGMIASDVDDFEFPRFEDLPRPAAYPLSSTQSATVAAENVDLYAWPVGCLHPNSCNRHGECMYTGCGHTGKPIKTHALTATDLGGGK